MKKELQELRKGGAGEALLSGVVGELGRAAKVAARKRMAKEKEDNEVQYEDRDAEDSAAVTGPLAEPPFQQTEDEEGEPREENKVVFNQIHDVQIEMKEMSKTSRVADADFCQSILNRGVT